MRRPDAVSIVTRSEPPHLNAEAGIASPWYCENFCCLPVRRRSDSSTRSAIGPHEDVGQLGLLDLGLHDLAQRRAVEGVGLERGGPGRVARAVDALQRGDQQLVLIGIGEQLDFVDGRHDAEHGTDARFSVMEILSTNRRHGLGDGEAEEVEVLG